MTKSPRPSQQRRSDHEQDDAEDRPLPVATHSRAVQHIRALRNPHEARETQHDTDDDSNPHG